MRGLNVGCPLPHLAVVGIGLVAKWQLMLLTVTLRNLSSFSINKTAST